MATKTLKEYFEQEQGHEVGDAQFNLFLTVAINMVEAAHNQVKENEPYARASIQGMEDTTSHLGHELGKHQEFIKNSKEAT